MAIPFIGHVKQTVFENKLKALNGSISTIQDCVLKKYIHLILNRWASFEK